MARKTASKHPMPGPDSAHVKCTDKEGGCEIQDLFRLLGKTHTLDILHLFVTQEPTTTLRFVEVQNTLKLSPNTLSERLKELLQAGLLARQAYNEIPPRVDYQATAKARDLGPVFLELIRWAQRHDLSAETAAAPGVAEAAG